MGKSVNPVFGRLASDVVGRNSIMSSVERFGFNQPLIPGSSIPPSKAEAPQNDMELMLMGAGLGREVKISPFHAALMMAAIANDGVMMLPSLAQEIKNGKGETIYSPDPPDGTPDGYPGNRRPAVQDAVHDRQHRHLPEGLP